VKITSLSQLQTGSQVMDSPQLNPSSWGSQWEAARLFIKAGQVWFICWSESRHIVLHSQAHRFLHFDHLHHHWHSSIPVIRATNSWHHRLARRQDFAARVEKATSGVHIKKKQIGCMQQAGMQIWNGGRISNGGARHHWRPR